MNDGGGDGAGCFDIKEWADTTELTNVLHDVLYTVRYTVLHPSPMFQSMVLIVCLLNTAIAVSSLVIITRTNKIISITVLTPS